MDELIRAFSLGSAAILTNACMLPLYPGLIAFLAGNSSSERSRRATGWLGLLVLAGVLTMMTLVGLVLYLLDRSFGDVLPVLLPLIYGLVILLGVLMLAGRNPFARLATAQAPILRNPYATAYLYGLMFGPMTLPCTGPIILSAFALGAGSAAQLANGLLFFIAFGLGFGWPLVLLPLIALPAQRRFIGWMTRHHLMLTRASGALLVAVGLFGIITELLPRLLPLDQLALAPQFWTIYWVAVIVVVALVAYFTYRQQLHSAPTRRS